MDIASQDLFVGAFNDAGSEQKLVRFMILGEDGPALACAARARRFEGLRTGPLRVSMALLERFHGSVAPRSRSGQANR